MRLVTTERLRAHDAGILELGVVYSDHMAIPPRTAEFEWHGHCLAECTAQVLEFCLVSDYLLRLERKCNDFHFEQITLEFRIRF